MTEPLHLTLLGPPLVRLGGQPLTELGAAKAQALLFYLAVTAPRGHPPHSRDALATLLWDGMTDAQAKKNLRTALPDLRRLLGHYLQIDREQIAFDNTQPYWLDVEMLRRDLAPGNARAEVAVRQAAVDLYQGEFLDSFFVHDAAPFEAWVLEQREELHMLVVNGLTALVGDYLHGGDHLAALNANRRLLALDPWSEPTHRQQMLLLAQTGERAAALLQYETCRRMLADEFGIEPLAETTALYEQIRVGNSHSTVQSPQSVVHSPQSTVQSQDDQNDPRLSTLVTGHNLPLRTKLFGRQVELASLHKWIVEDGCRLVAIFGIGGQGKSVLAATLVRELAEASGQPTGHFRQVIWQSLLNAPPLSEVLHQWVYLLSDQTVTSLPTGLDQQFGLLLNHLRRQRTLLILDNLESILQSGENSGHFRPGYEVYGQLLHRLAAGEHRSCLLLTSRERPPALSHLEEETPAVRSLLLTGLPVAAGLQILQGRGLAATPAGLGALVAHYSGNPLALKLAAETVHEFFDGDIAAFLQAESLVFDDIRRVLDQQFARLTPLEGEIMRWLAIVREPIAFSKLRPLLAQPPAPRLVLDAMRSLQRRSLLEKFDEGFGLQNVVLEYTTDLLVETISRELLDDLMTRWQDDKTTTAPGHPVTLSSAHLVTASHLNRHALILAQAKEYVRASQRRLLLHPIAERLRAQWGARDTEQQLQRVLARLHTKPAPGYAAANLLHLCLHLGVNLAGYDFSRLSVWQAYLRGEALPAVNLAQADLTDTVFTEPLGRILTVAFSPDGQYLAAGTREGTIHLWRTADQQLAQVIHAHHTSTCGLAFYHRPAAEGGSDLWLASAGENQAVGLWQVSAGTHQGWHGQGLQGHQRRAIGVGFSAASSGPPQHLVSVDAAGAVFVWDVATGHVVQSFSSHPSTFLAVAFSRDGQLLAIGSTDGLVRCWPVMGNRAHRGPGEPPKAPPSLTLSGHRARVTAVTLHPDNQMLASADSEGRICLWSLPQGRLQQVLETTEGMVPALAFSPDGRTLASSHWNHTICLWEICDQEEADRAPTARRRDLCHTLVGHTHVIRAVTFSPDGRMLASGGADQTVRVWDTQTGQPLYTLRGHYYALNALALSPDGTKLAAVGYDQMIHFWQGNDDYTAATHRPLQGHQGLLHAVSFSPDGRTIASAGRDAAIHLWDVSAALNTGVASGQLRRTLQGQLADIYRVIFHPSGQLIASCSADGSVWLWDLRTADGSQPARIIQANRGMGYAAAFSPDGHLLATAGAGRSIRLWDMTQPELPEVVAAEKTIQEPGEHDILALAFSPDGTKLACGSTHLVHVWELQNSGQPVILRHHTAWVVSVAFSPDGALLASAGEDRTICLWDISASHSTSVSRGELYTVLRGHSEGVSGVVFSPDGAYLLSTGADGAVKVWDVQTVECVNTLVVEGPYAGMNISGVTGITDAQKTALKALGAVEGDGVIT